MSRQSADQGKRLTGEHLLDRLPRHSELSGDIGLGQTIVNQHLHQVAALNCQRPRLTCAFDGLSSDLFDAPENLRMSRVPWNFGGGPMIIRLRSRSHLDGRY